jgi:hypothetical protein
VDVHGAVKFVELMEWDASLLVCKKYLTVDLPRRTDTLAQQLSMTCSGVYNTVMNTCTKPTVKSIKLVSPAKRKATIAKVIRIHSKALTSLADR